MLVNKNEVIPFWKSPWNALCKNGILLKIPLFSKPNFKKVFQSSTTTASFMYSQQPLNLQKSLGYAMNKFGRFYGAPEKSPFSRKLKKLQNLRLKQQLLYQKLFSDPKR